MSPVTIVQGITEEIFHRVPGELGRVTVSPERAAIAAYLARIDPGRFPEFVLDLLTQIEGHTHGDVVDGPGDEGQDIVTLTPDGRRHLTQCKHVQDDTKHFSGDSVDAVFVACWRKNSPAGLFVTNGDLTPQAKRYVTDREYSRSEQSLGIPPAVEYWNGIGLWERASRSQAILNKWFSGMGQAHGIRRFWFDLVIQSLPDGKTDQITTRELRLGLIGPEPSLPSAAGPLALTINGNVLVTLDKWFHRDLDLGVPYVGPAPSVNIPLFASRLTVTVGGPKPFDATELTRQVVTYIADRVLQEYPTSNGWWYLVATPAECFVFLQDLGHPQVVTVAPADTFVKVGHESTTREREWLLLSAAGWSRDDEDDDLTWHHLSSGTEATLLVEQRQHPLEAVTMRRRHDDMIRVAERMSFFKLKLEGDVLDVVRRLVPLDWYLIAGDEIVYAGVRSADQAEVRPVLSRMAERGLTPTPVTPPEKRKLIGALRQAPPGDHWMTVSSERDLVTPISLNKRTLWLRRDLQGAFRIDLPALVRVKVGYEAAHGYDFLRGKTEGRLSAAELKAFLFDLTSFRGDRMLDIGIAQTAVSINLRVSLHSLEATSALVGPYLAEFDRVVDIVRATTEFGPS